MSKQKEYTVRIEYIVSASEFADVTIEASSKMEAMALAIKHYMSHAIEEKHIYGGEFIKRELDLDCPENWQVKKIS